MLSTLLPWRKRSQPAVIQGHTQYETLILTLGALHALTNKSFSPATARTVKLTTSTASVKSLGRYLIDAAFCVSKRDYLPARITSRDAVSKTRTLEQYITDADELIHPVDWLDVHTHYIQKLVTSMESLDDSEAEYYQRKCNFIIEDLLALISASQACLK